MGAAHMNEKPSRIPADEHKLAAAIVEKIRQEFDDPLVVVESGVDRLSQPLITVHVNTRLLKKYSIRIETKKGT
jgi:hypothetical protein